MACRSPPQPQGLRWGSPARVRAPGYVSPGFASPGVPLYNQGSPQPGNRSPRGHGFVSPPRFSSPPRYASPPRLAGATSSSSLGVPGAPSLQEASVAARARRAAEQSGGAMQQLGQSYSITSLGSTDSGPGPNVRGPPKSSGSVLGTGQALQGPGGPASPNTPMAAGWQAQRVPPLPHQLGGAQSASLLSASPSGTGLAVGYAPGYAQVESKPASLFGRMSRSPAASSSSLPSAEKVAKPTYVIEEVIDFGIPEEEEVDMDAFERACQPRSLRGTLLGGCVLWNCSEEEERKKKEDNSDDDSD
eukprot:TRINITY_DN112009_c0_g1_i1.p1 TRINITY_DN112009_c0_g1~~TRINITY_DN112009_c0_g1_i1.p1  ORF type:complete len:315 (-),score=42.01 TRINITY_DN112009_c0_g1_i1:58-966(-)